MSLKNEILNLILYKQSLYRARKSSSILKDVDVKPITKEQKDMIKSVWGNVKIDPKWMSYFNETRMEGAAWSPYYIPDNIQYGIIDLFYSDYRKCRIIEDKNLNDLLYSELSQPKTILRKVSHPKSGTIFLDKDFCILSENQVLNLLTDGNLIVKPSIDSGGGKGVCLFLESNNEKEILKTILSHSDVIVQKVAKQHIEMESLNKSSLNTIRFVTFINGNCVHILSAVARMGSNKSHIDNASSGGLFCGIDNDGRLKKVGYNLKLNRFEKHPDSGIIFEGYPIPAFKELCSVVTSLATRFYGFSRLISWDLAVGVNGSPMLIEANMTFGGVDIPQIANGPLYGDLTKDVIKEVFSNKRNIWLSKFI